MSFILDALKKSESERLRQDTPGFSDVPDSTQEKSASHWIWIIVVLVGINITVLVVMFMGPDRAQDPVVANGPAAEATTDETGFSEFVGEVKRNQSATAEVTSDPVASVGVVAASPQNAASASAPGRSGTRQITESYATFNDLRVQGMLQLPDMHLDIHVYSSEPEDRFVFVNMSKYKERATLDEGPVVREITPDGVVLEHLGIMFLLPRE